MALLETPLAHLAREIPGVTMIFNQYNLSFSCNGKNTLSQAINEAGLEDSEITAAISRLTEQSEEEGDWESIGDQELILHLLSRYHQVHREQLAELQRLAACVETMHHDNEHCPQGLAKHLQNMTLELEQHMQKEENILFPMLAKGMGRMMGDPIRVMRHEHDQHTTSITKLDELTDGILTPKGACTTWVALYLGLRTFKADLQKHIHLENDILFARNQVSQEKFHD